jgi:acyl-CoA reductase-like NAD-dependent aldehyde dehydrogenase
MKIFLAGNWIDKPNKLEVKKPFDNSVVGTVPRADAGDLETALAFAERSAKVMTNLSSYDRWKILRKAADLMAARNEELGQLISKEEGKVIAEGRGKASRGGNDAGGRLRKPSASMGNGEARAIRGTAKLRTV